MSSIFISHTTKDKKFVRELASHLSKYEIKVWVDEAEIKIGDSLIKRIGEGINEMKFLGVVLSPNSVNSEWVTKEVEIAMTKEIKGKQIKVLPLLLKKCAIPDFLQGKLFADFTNKKTFYSSLDKILDVLGVDKNLRYGQEIWSGETCMYLNDFISKIVSYFAPRKTEVELYEDFSGVDFIKVYSGNNLFSFYNYLTKPSTDDILSEVFGNRIIDVKFPEQVTHTQKEYKEKLEELTKKYNLPSVSNQYQLSEKGPNGKMAYSEMEQWWYDKRLVSIQFV